MREIKDPRIEQAHAVDRYVGARVRERRKALKLSQIHLASRLGLTFQQVQKYERGSNRISASKLFEIGVVLQTPVSWFFEGYAGTGIELPASPANDVHAFLSTGAAIDLGEAFLAIPSQEQRRRLIDLMRAMGS
jgi:transcriptional regulator with XRE-family HTH domain